MVTLKRIEKHDNIIEFDYFPEGNRDDLGHVVYDTETEQVVNFKYCKMDEERYLKTYFNKAVRKIGELAKGENLPNERVVMWY